MCPSSHSSCSRTSIQAAPSMLLRLAGVDLLDPVLDLLEKFPVRGHCYTNDSSATRIPARLPLPWTARVRPASPCTSPSASPALVAAGVVVGLTLDTRDDAAPAEAGGRASRRCPVGLTGPAAPADRRRLQELAAREHRRRCSGSGSSTPAGRTPAERQQSAIVQYYRGVALLWAGYPSDAETALETGEEARPRHDHPEPRRQPAPPELLPADARARGYPVFVPVSNEPAAPAGLAAPAAGPPGLGRAALPAGGEAEPEGRRGARRRGGRPLRRGQPDAVVLAPRPALRALPEEPGRPLLPRAISSPGRRRGRRRSSSSS